jgi:hypothetical protein
MPPRRNRRPTPSPQSSPDRPAFLSSQLATPTPAADPNGSLELDLGSPPLVSTAGHLPEAADSDDPELLDRSHRSRSHSSSRSGSRGRSQEEALPEGMNAARRTPTEFHQAEREEGACAGSDAVQGDERREANSGDPAAEILRLRAELEAANTRYANFTNSVQISGSQSAPAPREIVAEISSITRAAEISGPSPNSPKNKENPSLNIPSSKNDERVFIASDEDERAPTQRAPTPRAPTPRAQSNKIPDALVGPEQTTPRPPQCEGAAEIAPTSKAVPPSGGSAKKRSAKANDTSSLDLLTSYRGAAAVYKPGQKISQTPSGKVAELKQKGANVPFDVPQPTVGANVTGVPTHDDNVAALLKFWPHSDAVAALAQTMMEEEGENLTRAHDFLMQQRDERVAAAVRREKEEGPGKGSRDDDAEEEAIREGGELAAFIAGAPDAITVVLHLVKVHKIQRNAHNAKPESTAANLIAHPSVQRFHDL